jgi:hypothetical protein
MINSTSVDIISRHRIVATEYRGAERMRIDGPAEQFGIAFEALAALTRGRLGRLDVPCPHCSSWPHRSARGARRRVLRVWQEDRDFAGYHCARCGLCGFARRPGAGNDRRRAAEVKAQAAASAQAHAEGQRRKARSMWRAALPAQKTCVERYLGRRGIAGPLPKEIIKYLPPDGPGRHPAMLVPYGLASEPEPGQLTIAEAAITAVHLTFLKPDGSGKADVDPAKITVGSPKGMPLMLAPMNDSLGLAITEGIEDALSVHRGTGLGAWAAGSCTLMPALSAAVPAYTNAITVIADDDASGQRGARDLAHALICRGFSVDLIEDAHD